MKKKLLLGLFSLCSIASVSYAQDLEIDDVFQVGGINNGGIQFRHVVDSDNNIITLTEAVSEDTLVILGDTNYAAISSTVFLSKFDENGTELWTNTFGSNSTSTLENIYLGDVVMASDNSMYLTAFGVNGASIYMNGTEVYDNSNGGSVTTFLLKFDENGSLLWQKIYTEGNLYPFDLEVNDNDEVFLGGRFISDYTFNGVTYSPPFNTNTVGFVSKLNANGTEMAFQSIDYAYAAEEIKVNSDGDLIIGIKTGDGETLPDGSVTNGISHIVAQFDPTDITLDAFLKIENVSNFANPKMTLTSDDDVYLTFNVSDTFYIENQSYGSYPDGGNAYTIVNGTEHQGILVKINGSDLTLNTLKYFNPGIFSFDIVATSNDEMYVTASTPLNEINVDNNTISMPVEDTLHAFVLKIDTDLDYISHKMMATTSLSQLKYKSALVNNDDELYVGIGLGAAGLHINNAPYTDSYSAADVFLIKMSESQAAGIDEVSEITNTVYPNPSNENITIESTNVLSNVAVYSLTGKLLKKFYPNANIAYIDITDLANGTYILNSTDVNGNLTQNKIQVVH